MSSKKAKGEADGDSGAKKGKGGILKMLLFAILLLGGGGGGAYGLMAAGILPGGAHEGKPKETGPQLVLKGEEDPYAPAGGEEKEGEARPVYGEGGSKYRTAYFTFPEEFTSNLKGSDALVQLSIAASTQRDGRVIMWLGEHQLAIRSRILIELADTPEEEVMTSEGKQKLQQRLTRAVNAVLEEEEGFGGVDSVYFRSFIVQ